MANVEKDALTGTETTGHSWDGIQELNTPLPKWWLYTFYACIIWAVGYWVVYPAWPSLSDYTKGVIGYSSRAEHAKEMEAVKASRSEWLGKFEEANVSDIVKDSQLLNYAMAGGRALFNENCAPCHGAGGQGAPGFPVLADDDWLWGGTLESIEQSVRFGIRSGHEEERVNEMPKYGVDGLITKEEMAAVADYVIGGLQGDGAGKTVFAEQCAACHGEDGHGLPEMGGPNLSDGIWLFGAGKDAVLAQLNSPKHGVMPAWQGRLDDVSIKQVSIYVHSLGGGQ
ncbi:MAG: cytochrome-c oxidase, cbb3-type subunit III [Rhodospirillales bacterium]|nr:cytochrome-c oxidase, cbb3-type subunit III [Rhodospirillales bacterium]MCW8862307.1 cytochrome-c oxidase, cbb3-type subunit III [Rhodospirillales bacterium]MCW8952843.1 cytochrome-c oxidase, cbb3-type subunit III [Rhodospirillales bacterium]MCW9001137.1 cytochrome-c oxidase, cbb3-type subunit III [Rhodospirillales bacterium]